MPIRVPSGLRPAGTRVQGQVGFDAQDALAASAVDLDELIRRGDVVEVPPTKQERAYE